MGQDFLVRQYYKQKGRALTAREPLFLETMPTTILSIIHGTGCPRKRRSPVLSIIIINPGSRGRRRKQISWSGKPEQKLLLCKNVI